MKRILAALICSLFVIVSVQTALAAKPAAQSSQEGQVVLENTIAGTIDINNADVDMLMSLPGIGEKTAQKIGDYRKANGPFKSIDDLLNVKGIGPKVLNKIRPLVKIS